MRGGQGCVLFSSYGCCRCGCCCRQHRDAGLGACWWYGCCCCCCCCCCWLGSRQATHSDQRLRPLNVPVACVCVGSGVLVICVRRSRTHEFGETQYDHHGRGQRMASHDADAQGCYEPRGKQGLRFLLLQVCCLRWTRKRQEARGKRQALLRSHAFLSHQAKPLPPPVSGELSSFCLPCVEYLECSLDRRRSTATSAATPLTRTLPPPSLPPYPSPQGIF